jgi:integrase
MHPSKLTQGLPMPFTLHHYYQTICLWYEKSVPFTAKMNIIFKRKILMTSNTKVKSKRYTGVYSRKLANGDISYYITYTDIDRKFKTIKVGTRSGGITEQYCHNKRNEVINKIRLGENPFSHLNKNTIITLDTIAAEYFTFLLNGGRKTHSQKEHRRYNTHIQPILGTKNILGITPDDINTIKFEKVKTLAPKTVDHLLDLISAIYNHAIKTGRYKSNNPVNNMLVKRFKPDNSRERFLSSEEVNQLLEAVKDDYLLNLFVRLSLSLGGRLNTILHIQKKDIHQRNVTLKDHKNNSTYMGHLPPFLFPKLSFLDQLSPNDYLLNLQGKRVSDKYIQTHLSEILNSFFNQGLEKNDRKNRVVIHTLRHTFASNLAMNGVPIFTIKKLVNHKDIKMTMRYAKLSPENGFDEVDKLYKTVNT